MNKTISLLLHLSGFPQTPAKTWRGRCLRRLNRASLVLALLYTGLHVFPQTLFAYKVTTSDITFYSRQPLPADALAACAARARVVLARSELAAPGRPENVFLCDSPWLFTLFCPPAARAFAFSVPWTDNVFVAAADPAADLARSRAPAYNTHAFSTLLAHEITHGLIRRRLGWLRSLFLPSWVAEGYCDYVAGESSFPEATGRYLLATGRNDPSPSFRYFEDRQMVSYLMEEQHLSFMQVVGRSGEFTTVEAQTRQSIRDHAEQ